MSSPKPDVPSTLEPVNNFFAGGNRRARQLAEAVPALRPAKPATARSRIAAGKTKTKRVAPLGPTPERLAKGDVDLRIGMHRSVPPIERLRDQGKLAPKTEEELARGGGLSYDARENQALYEAALKLRKHYEGLGISPKAQDLNRVIGAGSDDADREEPWVIHRDIFRIAVKLMGWFDHNPLRGNGRLVVAVVCEEMTVFDAALIHTGEARKERALSVGLDRLREGLFCLAVHWRMI